MNTDPLVFAIFVIFTGTAILSTFALLTRQSLLVAYILLGVMLGPFGLKLVADTEVINHVGAVGIVFLLFLLGLHLNPQDLWNMLRKVTLITLISSVLFAGIGYGVGMLFGFTVVESVIIGVSMMFSSTIIGLKLLPTTILHHQHIGEVMISILLMQDLLAIAVLILINAATTSGGFSWTDAVTVSISLPGLLLCAFAGERYVLQPLIMRFDHIKEYVFLLAIGWCLGMAELGDLFGLTDGVGAFIGGVSIAESSPIALYIAENLKPLRDFFLVMFFFSIGAGLNLTYLPAVIIPAIILAGVVLAAKPWIYSILLRRVGEQSAVSWEVGVRLAQSSEFSLLVVYLASGAMLIGTRATCLVEVMTILTFVVSCYFVVWRYPTPVALSDKMRRD